MVGGALSLYNRSGHREDPFMINRAHAILYQPRHPIATEPTRRDL